MARRGVRRSFRTRAFGRRSLVVVAVVTMALLGQLVPASAAPSSISLTASSATVAPGSTVDLTAGMPVVGAGSVSQEIVQQIDPTKVKLTAVSDITYPTGWSLSYCSGTATDCSVAANFSSTAPATTAAWANVKAVKATGALVTDGADAGRQIAQASVSGTAVAQTPLTLPSSGLGLDGFKVFFDAARTRVFNIYHHTSGGNLDCYVVLTGSRCVGFPFNYGGTSEEAALGVIVGTTAWIHGTSGLYCVDIAAVLSNTANAVGGGSPAKCFGSTGLVTLNAGTKFTWFTGSTQLGQVAETKLYALDSSSSAATIYCVDTATRSQCATPTYNPQLSGAGSQNVDGSNIFKWGDRLYVSIANGNVAPITETVSCVSITTGSLCPGWSSSPRLSLSTPSASRTDGKFVPIPDISGGDRAVCYFRAKTTSHTCWEADGTQTAASDYNFPNFTTANAAQTYAYGVPTQIGTRVYYGNSYWFDPTPVYSKPEVICYDALAANGAGGRCNDATANLSSSTTKNYSNYTVTPDPVIPDCLWVTQHSNPVFKTVNILTGELGCSGIAPQRATFPASTAVPRMGCSATGAIQAWRSFVLDTPATGFTSAKLTVQTSDSVNIAGWTNVTLTPGVAVDLSTLPVATSGQRPNFIVDISGATGSQSTTARISAIGDAPQLCLHITAIISCPSAAGPVSPSALLPGSSSVSASGASTDGSTTTSMSPSSTTLDISAPTASQCGGTLTGRAGDATLGTGGTAVGGVTVTLLDPSGNPVLSGGNAVTTTTAADGTYSFGYLTPASYKVSFPTTGTKTVQSATTVSGATGTTTGTATAIAGVAKSNVAAVAVGGNAVVNGLYSIPLTATNDTSSGLVGVAQTISVLANDNAASGRTITATAVKLCGPTESSPNCTLGSASAGRVVSGQGKYTVNSSGVVTFTPCSGVNTPVMSPACSGAFVGTATAVPYQITDGASTTSATVTPAVVGTPSASADTTTGPFGAAQSVNPLSNDSAATGATLVASSVRLCAGSDVAPTCTATSKSVSGEGTYSVDSITGVITFTPVAGYSGTASAVTYSVTDSLGQRASSTYVPTVVPVPSAASDASSGLAGTAQSIDPLANDSVGSGSALVASSVRLCAPADVAPQCSRTSLSVSGQGTFSVDPTTGRITFTPLAGYTGTASSVTYSVTDGVGQRSSSTYTPTVVGPSIASPDVTAGPEGSAQSIDPLANDTAGVGASLLATSVRLCDGTDVAPDCTHTSLTVNGQGVYSVDPTTGVLTFTPDQGYTGAVTPAQYSVTDSAGQKVSTTYSPTVLAVPSASPDTSSGLQGVSQSIDVLTNDLPSWSSSFDVATLRICDGGDVAPNCTHTSKSVMGEGTYTVDALTGDVTFAPEPAFTGTATPVVYSVTDLQSAVVSSTITPTVVGAPTAQADESVGIEGSVQSIDPVTNDAAGFGANLVRASVRFCDGADVAPSCTHTSVTVLGEGTYGVDPVTGRITFTPDPGFSGAAASVVYSISDDAGQRVSTTYTPTVVRAPSADADSTSGAKGQPQTIDPLANDAAGTGTSLDATSVRFCDGADVAPSCTHTSFTVFGEGSYGVDPTTGEITFTPEANFTGIATPVVYSVSDLLGQLVSNSYTPTVVPPPSASVDTSIGAKGAAQTIDPLSNDAAGTGGSLDPTSVRLCAGNDVAPNCTHTSLVVSGEGTFTVDQLTGEITFTPLANFTGTATGAVYSVLDDQGQRASSSYGPTVVPPPAASSDSTSGPQELSQTIDLLANDSAAVGAALDPATLRLCDGADVAPSCTHTSLIINGEGVFAVDVATGEITFTPDPEFAGTATMITYAISDSLGQLVSSTYVAVVIGRPTASPDAVTDAFDVDQHYHPALNDIADSSTTLDVSGLRLCPITAVAPFLPDDCQEITVSTTDGVYTLDINTGEVTFDPAPTFTGTATVPINYVIVDAIGQSATSTITPTVTPPPVSTASANITSGLVGAVQSADLLADDTAGTGVSLIVSSTRLCAPGVNAPNCVSTTLDVANVGTYSLSNGIVTFTPCTTTVTANCTSGSAFTGTAVSIGYQVADSLGRIVSSNYTPTVVPPPVANPDGSQGVKGATQTITLLSNDLPGASVAPLDPSTIRLCAPSESAPNCTLTTLQVPGEGTYTVNGSGTVTFEPDPAFVGPATPQRYVISDALGQVTSSTLQPRVVPPPAPVTADDVRRGPLDTPMTIDPLVNDRPGDVPDGSSGTVAFVRSSLRLCGAGELAPNCTATELTTADGTYVVDTNTGFVTFTPRNGFVGQVTQPVTYQIANDWTGPSGPGIATAVITPTIDPAAPPVEPPAPPTPQVDPGGNDSGIGPSGLLPRTGADACALVLWAAVLLGSGGALVILRRRAAGGR